MLICPIIYCLLILVLQGIHAGHLSVYPQGQKWAFCGPPFPAHCLTTRQALVMQLALVGGVTAGGVQRSGSSRVSAWHRTSWKQLTCAQFVPSMVDLGARGMQLDSSGSRAVVVDGGWPWELARRGGVEATRSSRTPEMQMLWLCPTGWPPAACGCGDTWNVASETGELNFVFCVILINVS